MSIIPRSQFGIATCSYGDVPPGECCRDILRRGYEVVEIGERWVFEDVAGLDLVCRDIKKKDGAARVPGEHRISKEELASFSAVCFHALFGGYDQKYCFVDEHARVQEDALNAIRGALELCAAFSRGTATIHVDSVIPDMSVGRYWNEVVAACRELGQLAGTLGVRLGAENSYPVVRDAGTAARFLDAVDSPAFGMTMDVGHFWSGINPHEFGPVEYSRYYDTPDGLDYMNRMMMDNVTILGDRIFHLHLHDVQQCRMYCDHKPLGSGHMDFEGLFRTLSSGRFSGTMVIEAGGVDESCQFVERFLL